MQKIMSQAIDPRVIFDLLKMENPGSVAVHCAVVRRSSESKVTSFVVYSALPGAEEELEQTANELRSRWQIEDIALLRRTGHLEPEEIISVVAVSAAHRKDAFGACEEAVARLKEMKCIEKKEVFRHEDR